MLSTELSAFTNEQCIIVRPNASLSHYHAILFFAGIALVSLIIGIRFLLLGAWMILPIALVELMLLALCLKCVLRSNQREEFIRIAPDQVLLTQHDAQSQQTHKLSRHWLRVIDDQDVGKKDNDWQPLRVLLRSHGQSHEVGSFVNNAEKRELAKLLRQALAQ
jgi:uncharacterized membrane protein